MAQRTVVRVKYCPDCLGTGLDINNNVCHCRFNAKSFYDTVSCLDIPEQYRGIAFNKSLVPHDLHESYANYLQSTHDLITSGKWKQHNVIITSPINHSKTILAYSCLEVLFRNGIPTFPVYDCLEIKRMLTDLDLCRKQIYDIENPESILTVPILFVKVPRVTSREVYDVMALLLDRRVRRGNSTIFLFDGAWSTLVYNDKYHILKGLMGDGAYNTLEVKSWNVDYIEKDEVQLQVPDNVG